LAGLLGTHPLDQEHRHSLPIGHEFDGYRIEGILGVGGFGITYLATEQALGRKVALKEYLPAGLAMRATEDMSVRPISHGDIKDYYWGLERFRQEAETLVNFHHPNIVAVHRFFESNGTAYLVMQFVEGQSLDQILTRQRVLAEADVTRFLMPILDGLEEVHRVGFLHRDVKPANIYLRTDGTPILLDFSAARQALTRQSVTLTAIVSDGYAPYEQYGSGGQLGPWTDIYGLGAVLYRCISGQRPTQAPDRLSAIVNGQRDPLPPAAVVGHGRYNPALLYAIDQTMRVFEKDRPQSVAAVRALIQAPEAPRLPRQGHPSRSASRSAAKAASVEESFSNAPTERTARQRNPALTTAILGVLMVLIAGAGFFVGSRNPGQDSARAAPNEAVRARDPADAMPPSIVVAVPPAQREREREDALPGPAVAGFADCAGCPEMVLIAAGAGVAGSPASEAGREPDEERQRQIAIEKPFALGRFEVTRAQFDAFVKGSGYRADAGCFVWSGKQWAYDRHKNWVEPGFKQGADEPVVCVSWTDAEAYAAWLAKKTGKKYRLPSELEWEYAARAGSREARHWGDDAAELCRHANGSDHDARKTYPEWPAAGCADGFVHTAPVGSLKANAFGLHDMLGNVAEWMADCWKAPGGETAAAGDAPATAPDCTRRVVRGGAFNYTHRLLRSAARLKANATGRIFNLGFRVARDAD
jgi:formylglycine-generating enzyme required for sulfatase activity